MAGKTYKIGEAAELLKLKSYVLRFWETEFAQLVPLRTEKGQRLYTEEHIELLRRIKTLLHDRGLTIEGARKVLSGETPLPGRKLPASGGFAHTRPFIEPDARQAAASDIQPATPPGPSSGIRDALWAGLSGGNGRPAPASTPATAYLAAMRQLAEGLTLANAPSLKNIQPFLAQHLLPSMPDRLIPAAVTRPEEDAELEEAGSKDLDGLEGEEAEGRIYLPGLEAMRSMVRSGAMPKPAWGSELDEEDEAALRWQLPEEDAIAPVSAPVPEGTDASTAAQDNPPPANAEDGWSLYPASQRESVADSMLHRFFGFALEDDLPDDRPDDWPDHLEDAARENFGRENAEADASIAPGGQPELDDDEPEWFSLAESDGREAEEGWSLFVVPPADPSGGGNPLAPPGRKAEPARIRLLESFSPADLPQWIITGSARAASAGSAEPAESAGPDQAKAGLPPATGRPALAPNPEEWVPVEEKLALEARLSLVIDELRALRQYLCPEDEAAYDAEEAEEFFDEEVGSEAHDWPDDLNDAAASFGASSNDFSSGDFLGTDVSCGEPAPGALTPGESAPGGPPSDRRDEKSPPFTASTIWYAEGQDPVSEQEDADMIIEKFGRNE